ncbi:MAG: hypothetical protein QOF06_1344 [Solirubrobacterales bacterium]|jgi:hypothetical protein|nr:hypothetical protein [Solirubrobacterales bacterium]
MTGDDWRLQVDFRDDGMVDAMHDRLDAEELEHDLSKAFHDRVIVSRNATTIFLYAGDREQAEKARELVARLAAEDGEEVELDFRRWHPAALEWRPADEPLPEDAAARAAEHQRRIEAERRESEEQGYPQYEVRVNFPSWGDAGEFAERLHAEGLQTVHRWRHVLVGAADEDAAKALAERIRAEAPAGNEVVVEATFKEIADDIRNPFAFLGGLGG